MKFSGDMERREMDQWEGKERKGEMIGICIALAFFGAWGNGQVRVYKCGFRRTKHITSTA